MSQNESLSPEEAEDSGGICGHERSQVTVQQQLGSLFSTEDFYLHDFTDRALGAVTLPCLRWAHQQHGAGWEPGTFKASKEGRDQPEAQES